MMPLFDPDSERRRAQRVADYDLEGFQVFWETYPRKEARKEAVKAWNTVQPSRETQQEIIHALEWQNKQKNWLESKRFIPLPATYLRGERWTDENTTLVQQIPMHRLTPFEQARRAGLK